MNKPAEIVSQLNEWGMQQKPFVFLIDFEGKEPIVFPLDEPNSDIFWDIPGFQRKETELETSQLEHWKTEPVTFEKFKSAFDKVMNHIHNGDTYLLNLTQPTFVHANLSLKEIFHSAKALYKVYFRNRFVCFSPETFVKIVNGKIYSYPMKGTIDADLENADIQILNDSKEVAEHNTIVDLIRNDLSLVAENVTVEKFRFLSYLKTNNRNLWQVSSEISGDLPGNYREKIGDILFTLLPAGSISGAPKAKTLEIISNVENYDRGYYTGIFGIFDGKNMDSCVLIRFIENENGQLIYKSGGGITFMSEAEKEYDELLKKVYVPTV
ncbi:MAG: aminodeoxychorismate synthase component I [Draconibacterium sp.]